MTVTAIIFTWACMWRDLSWRGRNPSWRDPSWPLNRLIYHAATLSRALEQTEPTHWQRKPQIEDYFHTPLEGVRNGTQPPAAEWPFTNSWFRIHYIRLDVTVHHQKLQVGMYKCRSVRIILLYVYINLVCIQKNYAVNIIYPSGSTKIIFVKLKCVTLNKFIKTHIIHSPGSATETGHIFTLLKNTFMYQR